MFYTLESFFLEASCSILQSNSSSTVNDQETRHQRAQQGVCETESVGHVVWARVEFEAEDAGGGMT